MVNNPIKCTPKESPIIKAININQRFPLGLSISCSQRNPSQNIAAIIKVAMAYTSVSTALNQNESVNVKAKLPTTPLPKIAMAFSFVISFLVSFLGLWYMIFPKKIKYK